MPKAKMFLNASARIQSLSARDKEKLAGIAEQYPPKVRALLGAILESLSLYSLCGLPF